MCCLLWLFLSGWHGSESSRTAGTGSLRNCNTFIGWATPCTGRGRDQLGYPMKRQMKWLNIQFLSVCWSQGSPLAPGQDCLVWVLVQVWASSIVSLLTRWLAVPAPNLSQGKNENQSEVWHSFRKFCLQGKFKSLSTWWRQAVKPAGQALVLYNAFFANV